MKLPTTTIKTKGWLQGDMAVWMVLILLCAISLIEVYSASSNMSYKSGKYWSPVIEHGTYVILGIVTAWTAHMTHYKYYRLLSAFFVLVSILLLVYALFFGAKVNGAGRWIVIAGRTIQPSEFAKISTIGFVAFLLTMRNKATGEAHSLGVKIALFLTAIMCLLILSENFSTSALLFVVIMAMLWIGRAPKKLLLWVLIPLLSLGFIVGITVKTMSPETAENLATNIKALHRLPTWVNRVQKDNGLPDNPKDYDVSSNQQVAHAQIAIATCNIVGKGPGKSVERDFLPQAFSDFIYAIIIEEGGIEFAFIVLFLYLFLLYRSWRIAGKCAAQFPAYLVMGLSLMLVLQAMINMGVAVGLLPVTGQPLPLVSKGGTSTLITCAYIGIILSVSRTARQKQTANDESAAVTQELQAEAVTETAVEKENTENA